MWMYAEVIDKSGAVIVRAEGEVSEDEGLAGLMGLVVDRFRRSYPGQSLVTDIEQAGYTIRFGLARLADAQRP